MTAASPTFVHPRFRSRIHLLLGIGAFAATVLLVVLIGDGVESLSLLAAERTGVEFLRRRSSGDAARMLAAIGQIDFLVFGVLVLAARRVSMTDAVRAASNGVIVAAVAIAVVVVGGLAYLNVAYPRVWNFLSFYLDAQVAAAGHGFYDVEAYRTVLERLEIPVVASPSFHAEVVEVGFKYPPPTMFLLLPLAWLGYSTANLVWVVFHLAILGACVGLLWRTLLVDEGRLGLAVAAVAVLLMPPALRTIYSAQSNFLVLLFATLLWRDVDRTRAGVWIAVGALVKPLFALMILPFLVSRRWRVAAAAIVAVAVALGLSAIAFQPDNVVAYLAGDLLRRVPAWMYTQGINQSLLAAILRVVGPAGGLSPANPLFLALAGVLTIVSMGLVRRLPATEATWGLGLTLCLALLVYPHSLSHYSVLVILPLLQLYAERDRLPGGVLVIAALFVAVYTLNFGFGVVGNVLLWCALALVVLDRGGAPRPSWAPAPQAG